MRTLIPIFMAQRVPRRHSSIWCRHNIVDFPGGRQHFSGFDLDGISSVEDDGTGCGIGDYTNELGEDGVDNAIARLVLS